MKIIIVLIGIVLYTLIFAYALCDVAHKYDELMERENKRMEQQKAYEEYRRKFANDRKISEEEANDYQAVKAYKECLEQEHGVTISE